MGARMRDGTGLGSGFSTEAQGSSTDTGCTLQVAIMFPINSLRNVGLLLAATPLVMMMDLDMLMSRELSALADGTDRQASSPSPQPQSPTEDPRQLRSRLVCA